MSPRPARLAALLGATAVGAAAARALARDVREAAVVRDELEGAPPLPVLDGLVGAGRRPALRVAVLGDSTAAGLGLDDPQLAWPWQTAQRLSARIDRLVDLRQFASRGHRLRTVLEEQVPRLVALAPDWEPDLVLLSAGGNDALGMRPPWSVARDQHRLVVALREACPRAHLLLVGCPRLDDGPGVGPALSAGLAAVSEATRRAQMAQARRAEVRITLLGRYGPGFNGEDGFHASERAHAWAAERTVAALAGWTQRWRRLA